jgi:hypothetical protein
MCERVCQVYTTCLMHQITDQRTGSTLHTIRDEEPHLVHAGARSTGSTRKVCSSCKFVTECTNQSPGEAESLDSFSTLPTPTLDNPFFYEEQVFHISYQTRISNAKHRLRRALADGL